MLNKIIIKIWGIYIIIKCILQANHNILSRGHIPSDTSLNIECDDMIALYIGDLLKRTDTKIVLEFAIDMTTHVISGYQKYGFDKKRAEERFIAITSGKYVRPANG